MECLYCMRRFVMLLLVSTLGMSACKRDVAPAAEALPVYTVTAGHPTVGNVTVYREWIGHLEADVAAEVLPRVEGYVLERLFTNGQTLEKGQVIYKLDDTLYAEALQQAQQQEAQAAANAQEAEQNVEYYRPLVKDGSVARQTFTEAQRKAEAAQAALQAARAAVAQAKSNVEYCTLRSPLSGIAGFARADVGSFVSPGGAPMVTVSSVQPIRVSFSISEQDWLNQGGVNGTLRPGAEVQVQTANGSVYPYSARITGVDNEVSSTMGTLQMDALLENPQALLRPGMYVTVRAAVAELKDALLVPQAAIVSVQGQQFVLSLDSASKVSMVPVTTGALQGENIVVQGAISPQSLIVTSGTQQAMMAAAGRAVLKVEK